MTQAYARVLLLNACNKLLTYTIPHEMQATVNAGSIVRVPVHTRYEYAIVHTVADTPTEDIDHIKPISCEHATSHDPHYVTYLDRLCTYYAIDKRILFRRIRQSRNHKHVSIPQQNMTDTADHSTDTPLNAEQQHVVEHMSPYIHHPQFCPALLHGVTGSGKTHVYTALARECLSNGTACIWLAPETTLALQLEQRIRSEAPDIPCYSFHSATSQRDKQAAWKAIYQQEPCIIIGVHIPVLLPLPHLGCIIVDEEHDPGFQEKKHPKIHSKEAAILRAQAYGIPIVMGSATPSMQSLYNTEKGVWTYYALRHRYNGAIAPISIAYLTHTQKEKRRHFWITKQLENGIRNRLERGEQVIIFLNRRGYNFFIRCGTCGYTFCCTHCSVSVTPHNTKTVQCHYCHRSWPEPHYCTSCQADSSHFIRKGIGTQQTTTILQDIFPEARIARADLDTTVHKKKWQSTLDAFTRGDVDILVGTQSITKGYDFPNVTLVGLVWADINLGMPVYNTAERTLQQILQVAGRAGRHDKESHVIAQVMLDHPLLAYAHEDHYQSYYQYEMDFRKELGYPPCGRFAAIELRHTDAHTVERDARAVHQQLAQSLQPYSHVLGPTQPTVSRIQGVHIRMIYIKSRTFNAIYTGYQHITRSQIASDMFLNPNASE